MNLPLVSVILPVFNGAQTLEAALHSITSQEYAPLELIVVDGQSTDGTTDILAKYSAAIVVLISEPDQGIYDAINKGIRKSTGEWIYILGADDTLADSGVLQQMLSTVGADTKLILGNVEYTGEKQSLVPRVHHSSWSSRLYWRNTVHQQGALYHRSLFSDASFDSRYRILGDYDFHLKLYRQAIKTEQHPVIVARCAAQGTSKRFSWKLYGEEITLKRRRLSMLLWVINLPIICAKYALKQLP
ncbi:MAG: glycosyltransferase family 2 protein [Flavobacteriales bacterium]|jgi:putative colanic acid biosynthesis glycosyltransferase